MNAEDFPVDDRREAEIVEDLGAVAPDGDRAVLSQALIVEAVDLCDLTGFVISSDQRDAVGIADLEMMDGNEIS